MSRSVNPQPPKTEFLWYIPNQVDPGHRGDEHRPGTQQPRQRSSWPGSPRTTAGPVRCSAPGGAGRTRSRSPPRGRAYDDVPAAGRDPARLLAARALRLRGGHARPASGGRLLINIVSGQDNLAAYGDSEGDQAQRYARTKEFLQLVRRLWTEEDVTFTGEHFSVTGSTVATRPVVRGGRITAAVLRRCVGGRAAGGRDGADVQLFWGEPLDGIAERIAGCGRWSRARSRARRRWSSGCGSPRWSATPPRRPGPTPRPRSRRWPRPGRHFRTKSARGSRRSASSGCSNSPSAARSSTTTSTPPPASTAEAAPAPRGWSARPTTSPSRCAGTRTSGITHFILSDTPYAETARVGDSCCRCCGRRRWSPRPPDARRRGRWRSASCSPLLSPPAVAEADGAAGEPEADPERVPPSRRGAGRLIG